MMPNVDWMSGLGAVLLITATVPQAVKLFRTRDASSFSAPFVALNAAGIGLLLARSIQIGEIGFSIVNSVTFTFWLALAAFKARDYAQVRSASKRAVTLRPGASAAREAVAPPPPR